jgi:tRNA(Ile)-lysidine synthase
MRPVTSDGLIRPLLDVSRDEIETWLHERGLAWREDSSNADLTFARNRIRHQLLPQLEREWNPQLAGILANHARLAQDDEDYWRTLMGETSLGGGAAILELPTLLKLLPALQRRVVRDRIRQVKGDLRGIDFCHIEQVLDLTCAPDGHGRVQIPGVDVMRSFDWLRFVEPRPGPEERDWEVALAVPGEFAIPGGDCEIVLEVTDSTEVRDTLRGVGLDWPRLASGSTNRLVLRNWRPGDRYQRVGHAHEQKVKQMFHEARVPLWERRNWPMVCVAEQVVWSRLFGPAAPWAAAGGSGPVLRLRERKRIDIRGRRVE